MRMNETNRSFCDGEHKWEEVDQIEWTSRFKDQYYTQVYDCADCDARRWSAEEKRTEQSVFDW